MTIALIAFGIAAVGGLVLAGIRFSGKPYPPLGLALVHGAFAAAGLVILLTALGKDDTSTLAWLALLLFLGAAGGGFVLFSQHWRKVALSRGLVVVHALVAVVAFVFLLIASVG